METIGFELFRTICSFEISTARFLAAGIRKSKILPVFPPLSSERNPAYSSKSLLLMINHTTNTAGISTPMHSPVIYAARSPGTVRS